MSVEKLEKIINVNKSIQGYSIVHRNEVLSSSGNAKNIPVIVHNVNHHLESKTSEISNIIIDGEFKTPEP